MAGLYPDCTLVCELDGVAEKVGEHLLQSPAVGQDLCGDGFGHVQLDTEPLGFGLGRKQADGIFQEPDQREGRRVQIELARLELREIQDVVHNGEQGLAAGHHPADIDPGLRRQVRHLGEKR